MVVANKSISLAVESGSRRKIPHLSTIIFQQIVSVMMCMLLRFVCCIDFPMYNKSIINTWLPLNLFFVAMLSTSFISQFYVAIPLIQQFKNISMLLIVFGSSHIFGDRIDTYTVAAASIMSAGSFVTGLGK